MVKNDINELYMWTYKIGLNNWICKKIGTCTKKFSIKIQREQTKKFSRVTDEHCGKKDIKELQVGKYKVGLNN